ncbi:TMEM175 family protein [Roseivirga echinicomitans]
MTTNRLEAFSDGVMAIIITIFVLEMQVPKGADFESLQTVLPTFLTYVLSFIYVGIYWNNHHHLWQAVDKVTGEVL